MKQKPIVRYYADDLTHENDLEGCLLIVEKEDSLLGITRKHMVQTLLY
jgi:hypothetical protein